MRMAPLPGLDGEEIYFGAGGGVRKSEIRDSIESMNKDMEDIEDLTQDKGYEDLTNAIEELREEMGKLEAKTSAQPQSLPGQILRVGSVVLGWEDIILFLVLIVIFVSWVRGSMTTQDTLVTLMGAGAGGAWGIATGRGFSPPT